MRPTHNVRPKTHWTSAPADMEPLQQWSCLMEAKRKQDFLQASSNGQVEANRFDSAAGPLPARSYEELDAGGGGKPVASVRYPIAARRVSTPAPQRTTDFEPLLDLQEASAILGMHWKTLEAKARGREVPAFKVGKRWRFRLSSLNSWLDHGINSNTTGHAVVTGQERCS